MRESSSPELWAAHAGSPLDASALALLAQVGTAFMHGVRRADVDTLRNHHAMHDARLAHALQGLMNVGVQDLALITATHPNGAAIVLGSPLATARNLTQRERREGELLAGHLACGLRLRAREARRPRPYPAGAGRTSEDLSSDMRAAALAADATSADLHEGEAAWVGMLQGRWVGEHRFDEDGRRYVIAREVPVGAETRAGLSARQQRVLALRHKGYPLKKIAGEIGCSVSTASVELQRAVKALGLRGVNDLGGEPSNRSPRTAPC
jgi:DNA-binding CsgD family transcriptional regulator